MAVAYRQTVLPLRERLVALSQRNYDAMLLGVYQLLATKQNEANAYREYIEAVRDRGIRTVVTLRDSENPSDPPPDLAEQRYCEAEEINYFRISPRKWWSPDGSVPAALGVRQFLAVMDDPANYPVLVHCYAGVHRTGAFCAVYRMEYDHWTNAEAIRELLRERGNPTG